MQIYSVSTSYNNRTYLVAKASTKVPRNITLISNIIHEYDISILYHVRGKEILFVINRHDFVEVIAGGLDEAV